MPFTLRDYDTLVIYDALAILGDLIAEVLMVQFSPDVVPADLDHLTAELLMFQSSPDFLTANLSSLSSDSLYRPTFVPIPRDATEWCRAYFVMGFLAMFRGVYEYCTKQIRFSDSAGWNVFIRNIYTSLFILCFYMLLGVPINAKSFYRLLAMRLSLVSAQHGMLVAYLDGFFERLCGVGFFRGRSDLFAGITLLLTVLYYLPSWHIVSLKNAVFLSVFFAAKFVLTACEAHAVFLGKRRRESGVCRAKIAYATSLCIFLISGLLNFVSCCYKLIDSKSYSEGGIGLENVDEADIGRVLLSLFLILTAYHTVRVAMNNWPIKPSIQPESSAIVLALRLAFAKEPYREEFEALFRLIDPEPHLIRSEAPALIKFAVLKGFQRLTVHSAEYAKKIVDAGVLRPLAALLRSEHSNGGLKGHVCKLLEHLASSSANVKNQMIDAELLVPLLLLLGGDDKGLICHAAWALSKLVYSNGPIQQSFVGLGGLRRLLPLLQSTDTAVKASAAELLGSLAIDNNEVHQLIIAAGVLKPLLAMLQQAASVGALTPLFTFFRIKHLPVRVAVAFALGNLAIGHNEVQQQIVEAGALLSLLPMLRDSEVLVKAYAARALMYLSHSNTRIQEDLISAGVVVTLINLLGDADLNVRAWSAAALVHLIYAPDGTQRQIEVSNRVLEDIIKILKEKIPGSGEYNQRLLREALEVLPVRPGVRYGGSILAASGRNPAQDSGAAAAGRPI